MIPLKIVFSISWPRPESFLVTMLMIAALPNNNY